MLVSVVIFLGATFAAVGWIGWRYFLASPMLRGSATGVSDSQLSIQRAYGAGSERVAAIRSPVATARQYVRSALWLAPLLACGSAAGVLALSGIISLDPLSAPDLARQSHIQAALNPEALVPPPSLPPSTFVGTGRTGLETANRDWARLNPDFMAVALMVFARAEARGYPLALLEGYRGPDRQDALAESARHVTNARAFQSKHQYGLALDAAPIRNGKLVISEKDPWALEAYRVLGDEAEKAGLIWGGRWKLKDYGHIEAAASVSRHANRS